VLSIAQKCRFRDEGYLVLPGAVSRAQVTAARHAINHSLGEEGMNKDELPRMRSQTYCREIREDAAISDLANRSSVIPAVESLVGAGNVQTPGGGQIALRFPRAPGEDPGAPRGHLDGLGSGANGIDRGVYNRGFTSLAVVYLCDVPEPNMGNFTVWPGSHLFFAEHLRQNGHEILAEGMPQVELPQGPLQITGQRGDLVIAHHLLVHTAAPNTSSETRYAAIFRLRHKEVESVGLEAFTDLWREWPGVAELDGAPAQ
jgi:hypothetical protein